jgi:hypothetical protein
MSGLRYTLSSIPQRGFPPLQGNNIFSFEHIAKQGLRVTTDPIPCRPIFKRSDWLEGENTPAAVVADRAAFTAVRFSGLSILAG